MFGQRIELDPVHSVGGRRLEAPPARSTMPLEGRCVIQGGEVSNSRVVGELTPRVFAGTDLFEQPQLPLRGESRR